MKFYRTLAKAVAAGHTLEIPEESPLFRALGKKATKPTQEDAKPAGAKRKTKQAVKMTLAEFWRDNVEAAIAVADEDWLAEGTESSTWMEVFGRKTRYRSIGESNVFRIFKDGSAWDEGTGKIYTAAEFRRLRRKKDALMGEIQIVLPE